ncbi:tetratricopeptide repeat protein [Paraburkholderia sp.]|uniref:tetratricopeptide repeat protein n=1 Tax=Paraburkholderia sp. TaxID=1926495 RepID=UPI003D6F559D
MMRNRVHLVFGAIALCCVAAIGYNAACLLRAQHVNRAIDAASASPRSGTPNDSGVPEARLARAVALSKAGAYDAAGKLYDELIHTRAPDDVARTALFDLGNLYLREGIGNAVPGAVPSVAMIDEAKARYRTLLRAAPDDWDARYNLERALWLAPETREPPGPRDVQSQSNIKVHDPQSKDLP